MPVVHLAGVNYERIAWVRCPDHLNKPAELPAGADNAPGTA